MLDNYENQHCNSTLKNIVVAKYPELKRTDEKVSVARDTNHAATDKVGAGSFANMGNRGRSLVDAVARVLFCTRRKPDQRERVHQPRMVTEMTRSKKWPLKRMKTTGTEDDYFLPPPPSLVFVKCVGWKAFLR